MIGLVASTVSMMAASLGLIDSTDSTASTASTDSTDSTDSTTSTKSSLSATSAFHGGGVGAGVPGGVAAGAGAPHTDTRAVMATATTVPVMDTAIAVGLEWLNYRADSLARAITMALSTESWDLRLGEQFEPTSATMAM
jgi:hypothetical protein